jgi:hypothetical protein
MTSGVLREFAGVAVALGVTETRAVEEISP